MIAIVTTSNEIYLIPDTEENCKLIKDASKEFGTTSKLTREERIVKMTDKRNKNVKVETGFPSTDKLEMLLNRPETIKTDVKETIVCTKCFLFRTEW